jgi:hypothetical protein
MQRTVATPGALATSGARRSKDARRITRAARAAQRFDPWSLSAWWARRHPGVRLALVILGWGLGYMVLRPEGQALLLSPGEGLPEPCACGHDTGVPRLGKSFGTTVFPLFYTVSTDVLAMFWRWRVR